MSDVNLPPIPVWKLTLHDLSRFMAACGPSATSCGVTQRLIVIDRPRIIFATAGGAPGMSAAVVVVTISHSPGCMLNICATAAALTMDAMNSAAAGANRIAIPNSPMSR